MNVFRGGMHGNILNNSHQQLSNKNANGNCCVPQEHPYVTDFAYDEGTNLLTLTLSDGSSFAVDLSELEIVDGNVSGASYNPATGQVTITSTVGGPYMFTIDSIPTLVANTVFVHTSGSDATGIRQRVDKPFATPWAAVAAANSGDTVVVYSGDYMLGASAGTEKMVKDGVRVLLHPNAVLTFTVASSAQPFSDGGVGITSGIYGDGAVVWNQAADMLTSSVNTTNLSIYLRSFTGGRIYCGDYNIYRLSIVDTDATNSLLNISPTTALSGKECYVSIAGGIAGGLGANVVRYTVLGGLVASNCIVDIRVNLRVRNLNASAILIAGIGGETKLIVRANLVDIGGTQAGYVFETGLASDASNFDVELLVDWSYGVLLMPVASTCNVSGRILIVGNIGDHAPAADLDVRGSRAGLDVDVNLNIAGSTNTFGVIRGNGAAANPAVRRTHVRGRIRSTGTVSPIYLDAAAAPIEQYVSLSHLTIFTNAVNSNNANGGPGAIQAQVNKVRSNKAVNVALFTQQGEVVQVVATTIV